MDSTNPSRLLLLPGMDGTGTLFAPFVEALPTEARAEALRYPPERAASYAELASRVMDDLPRDESFVLLAESFSGPIAVDIAARHPEGLVALVLVATFLERPSPLLGLPTSARARRSLFARPPPRWLLRAMLTGGDAELARDVACAMRSVSADVFASRLGTMATIDVRPLARDVRVPTLYLRAKRDRLIGARHARLVEELVPDAERVDIDGPHLLLQASPQASADAIASFLARRVARYATRGKL